MELEKCSSEYKEAYHSIYALARSLDEQKRKLTTISQLFNPDIERKRLELIQKCQKFLLKDNHAVGKKIREILWRKGYYEFIAFIKKNWHKEDNHKNVEWSEKLQEFILEGISNYKRIIIKLEKIYDLDLQLLVDFSIINNENGLQNGRNDSSLISTSSSSIDQIQKSLETVGFALDTIHSSFLSIGDLHRYYIDFKFNNNNNAMKSSLKITINKKLTARYYYQAFQLNPTIGMAQNQLGTLFYGQNYDLDSIYHYLYSLICTVPFDLSETNVCKLFVSHAEYLEELNPDKVEFSLHDFYARLFLIVDIFFFDKNVPDFNSLCHCVLIDLKKILCSKIINIDESSIFKIVCILLFCISKLKMIDSQKVYSLNAFIVAVCSDLIDSCIVNLEQFILSRSKQNEKFQEIYTNAYNIFEENVRKSRQNYKTYYKKDRRERDVIVLNSKIKMISKSSGVESDNCKSQKTSQDQDEKRTPSDIGSRIKDVKKTEEIFPKIGRNSCDSQPKSLNSSSNKSSTTGKRNGKQNTKLRRRRRRIIHSGGDDDDDEDNDDESSFTTSSDSELDTDFSSNDEDFYGNDYDDVSDLSSNFESDFSDIEENTKPEGKVRYQDDIKKENHKYSENFEKENQINEEQNHHNEIMNTFSDNEDMVIEEERIIYPNDPDAANLIESFNGLNMINDMLHFKSENEDDIFIGTVMSRPQSSADNDCVQLTNECNSNDDIKDLKEPPVKLKYKNKYTKIDPNIIIEFAKNENTIRALKILFDWLYINNEILLGCYNTNPEFIHKIMKLINFCNIDIFTKKVYFERELIKFDNVRDNLEELFLSRSSIPLSEDMILKGLDLLKSTQSKLDWETPIRDRITEDEENIMRIFKMVDFAFFVCKLKKFNYNFCTKSRRFTENVKGRRDKKRLAGRKHEHDYNHRRGRNYNNADHRCRNNRNNYNDRGSRNGGRGRKIDNNHENRRGSVPKMTGNMNEVQNLEQDKNQITVIPRKGYLRNRNQAVNEKVEEQKQQQKQQQSKNGGNYSDDIGDGDGKKRQKNIIEEKCKLMGRLWLKNEVETLEAELKHKPMHIVLTPFIVVDAKALTEYTGIVKALVQSKKFIVLIPNAVLGELDQLKKQSDCARNAIRWLEQEFKVGNRHMRVQRDHETKPLPLIKIPKKLDRESSVFVQIAKFCNFMVSNHSDNTEYEANLITFLSGDHLNDKKTTNLSFTGILEAIPVRHDQISNFYEKFKKK